MNEQARLAALQEQAKQVFGPSFGKEHAKSTMPVSTAVGESTPAPPSDPATQDFDPVQLMKTARGRLRLRETSSGPTVIEYMENEWVFHLEGETDYFVCDKCWHVFSLEEDDGYSTAEVYYHGPRRRSMIQDKLFSDDDDSQSHCNSLYTNGPGDAEPAWYCAQGCFHHDSGQRPQHWDVWQCSCENVFANFWEAKLCHDSHG